MQIAANPRRGPAKYPLKGPSFNYLFDNVFRCFFGCIFGPVLGWLLASFLEATLAHQGPVLEVILEVPKVDSEHPYTTLKGFYMSKKIT